MPRGRPPQIGRCIYCGTTDPPLTKEHIIGRAIGGDLVLGRAACERHAAVTSQIERSVFGETWLAPRLALGFRTARRQRRPAKFPLKITRGENEVTVDVPVEDFPAVLSFPVLDPPGRLLGREPTDQITIRGTVQVVVGRATLEDFTRKQGAKSVAVTVTFVGHAFARMLAKVGYAFAVWASAQGTIPPIGEVYVLPAILGTASDVGTWVGSAPDTQLANTAHRHALTLWIHQGEIFVRLALFAQFGAPEYLVLVGRVA